MRITADSLEAVHQQIMSYDNEHIQMTADRVTAQADQPQARNLRAAPLEARREINPEGAALVDFILEQLVERQLSWPELREHIDRQDEREALNVLWHLQSFTSRRFGAFVLVKQGGRGRTRYHLNPAYA